MASTADLDRTPPTRAAAPVRQKSGLVRAAGPFDAFVFALSGISVGIMFAWGQLYGTSLYPGGNVVVAMIISTVMALLIAAGYQFWARVFPRSGGDFVFLSRGLHPGVALGVNFVFLTMLLVSPALAMNIMQPLVSSFAAVLQDATGWGFLGDLSTWLAGKTGFAVTGTLLLVVTVAAGFSGIRGQIRLLQAIFTVAAVGSVIVVVALLFSSRETFLANLTADIGVGPDQVSATATKNGFATGGFSLEQTLKITNWFAPSLFFAMVLVYIGGEIKDAQRTVGRAMRAAVIFSGVFAIVLGLALNRVVPTELQGALGFNALVSGEATTASTPYPFELMRVLWGTGGFGLVLTCIAYIAMFCWVSIWWAVIIPFSQRGFFAWSLDGVAPKWLSKVDARTHAPYPALLAAALFALGWILALAYRIELRTIATLVPVYVLLALTLAVGAAFPYTRRSLYDQSPIARVRIGGLPAMSVVCAAGAIVVLFGAWLLWNDPNASGTDRTPIWIFLGLAIAVTAYYFVLQAMKRRRGVDISSTFDEIPVE
jgi:amino acid transporter